MTESTALTSRDQLLLPFAATWASPHKRLGLEAERVALFDDGTPLRYSGDHGVLTLFDELSARHGWTIERDHASGKPLSLVRGMSNVTLEPGCQFELSGAPHDDVHAVAAEVRAHVAEMQGIKTVHGLHLLGIGFSPLATRDELEWVPKPRYPIMRQYLPTRGAYGLDMMLRTATVQVNVDHHSESDAVLKLRVLLGLAPVAQALFACSPFVEGKRTEYCSNRARVWLDVDNSRAGVLPSLWGRGATLGDYVDWAFEVPMLLVKRGDRVLHNTGQRFRDFWADGFEGERATVEDWELHLNTLWPDVRLKRTLELRTVDSVPSELSLALPALIAGLVYDAQALGEAEELVHALDVREVLAAREHVARDALDAELGKGVSVRALAKQFVALARKGLARRGRKNAQGQDESVYLDALEPILAGHRCAGDMLLGGLDPQAKDFVSRLVERVTY